MREDARLRLLCLHQVGAAISHRIRERASRLGMPLSSEGARATAVLVVFDVDHFTEVLSLLAGDSTGANRIVLGFDGAQALDDRTTWRLLAAGAADLIDVREPQLDAELGRLRSRLARWCRLDALTDSKFVRGALVGETRVWRSAVLRIVEAAVTSTRPVLLAGETGTGKEEAARVMHDLDETRKGPFVVVDCASIVESLSGSELFGHRRGAFTGAERDRDGAIARADQGTLFLDEIGELKSSLQVEFLRVLQEGTFKAVGDDRPRQSRFRLISATHRDLEAMVRAGTFRSDLYYRISAETIRLPPLRDRIADVPLLLRHFLKQFLETDRLPEIDPRLDRALQSLTYEGNVRQLRSIVQGLAATFEGDTALTLAHLPRPLLAGPAPACGEWNDSKFQRCMELAVTSGIPLSEVLEVTRNVVIRMALRHASGSAAEAANRIQVSRRLVELRRASWRTAGADPDGRGAAALAEPRLFSAPQE